MAVAHRRNNTIMRLDDFARVQRTQSASILQPCQTTSELQMGVDDCHDSTEALSARASRPRLSAIVTNRRQCAQSRNSRPDPLTVGESRGDMSVTGGGCNV